MPLHSKKKIYIAGHTGLLGSALVRTISNDERFDLILRTRKALNLLDQSSVFEFMQKEAPDCVILAAAKVGGIQANINDPVHFLYENQIISSNVIYSSLKAGVKELIYIGSSCMYPKDYKTPLKEEYLLAAPLEPTNEGYALAKISGAKLCEYCSRQYSVNYRVLIPCNLYGPNDKFDPESSHLIAAIIRKLHEAKINGSDSVAIWGDGSARREFLFVEDIAGFIHRSLDFIDELPHYLNIGYGKDFSVSEYYQTAAEVIGYKGKFEFDKSRPVGMARKLLDSSRAEKFGWHPTTNHKDGIAATYSYYLDTMRRSG